MINIILSICCILMGLLLGIAVKKQIVARAEVFSDAVKYAELFKLNVTGKRLEVAQFNANFLQECSKPFRAYFTDKDCCRLSAQQRKHLKDFFDNLDCINGEALLQHLNFCQSVLQDDLSICKDAAAKSSLFVKLGLLLGVMVGILFL